MIVTSKMQPPDELLKYERRIENQRKESLPQAGASTTGASTGASTNASGYSSYARSLSSFEASSMSENEAFKLYLKNQDRLAVQQMARLFATYDGDKTFADFNVDLSVSEDGTKTTKSMSVYADHTTPAYRRLAAKAPWPRLS